MKNSKAERELSLDFLRVCEAAAIEAAKTMGQGDRKYSDHVAVEAMRKVMDSVPMRGRIVIGEGERIRGAYDPRNDGFEGTHPDGNGRPAMPRFRSSQSGVPDPQRDKACWTGRLFNAQ